MTGDDLWSDMLSSAEGDLYLETVANDPTLMEMSVAMASMTAAPSSIPLTPTGPTSNTKGKGLSPSEEIGYISLMGLEH